MPISLREKIGGAWRFVLCTIFGLTSLWCRLALALLGLSLPPSVREPVLKAVYWAFVRPLFFIVVLWGRAFPVLEDALGKGTVSVAPITDDLRQGISGTDNDPLQALRAKGLWSANAWRNYKKRRNNLYPAIEIRSYAPGLLPKTLHQQYRSMVINYKATGAAFALTAYGDLHFSAFPWTRHFIHLKETGQVVAAFSTMEYRGTRVFGCYGSPAKHQPPLPQSLHPADVYQCIYDFEYAAGLRDPSVQFLDWGCTQEELKQKTHGAEALDVYQYMRFLFGLFRPVRGCRECPKDAGDLPKALDVRPPEPRGAEGGGGAGG